MEIKKHTVDRLKGKYGNWVLLTGASSGIGKALAYDFAKAGFHLVLTGRRDALLQQMITDLFDQFGTEAIPVPGDLSKPDNMEQLLQETDHLPIGIVILNAGFGTSGEFINSDIENELNMLDLNCKSVARMSHYYANKIINDSRKGAIVLLSSMLAFQGVPNAANYAATKAYVQSFGEGLYRELRPKGVDILCAAPGPVDTEFSKRANMKMGNAMTASSISASIIRAIGIKNTVLPGRLTKLLVYNLRMLPRSLKIKVLKKVMTGFTKHQKS